MRGAAGFLEVMARDLEREGVSLRQYARRLGVHHTTLVHLRQRGRNPSVRLMDAAEAIYGGRYQRDYLFPRLPDGEVP